MRFFPAAVVLLVVAGSACESRPPEQQLIIDAAEALGGRDRILAAKSIVIEGEGSNGNLGQDMTPEATGQTFAVTALRRSVDLGATRMRTEQTRTPKFAYFQGMAPQRQISGLDGEAAYNVGANGTAARASEVVARERRAEYYHHPITIIRAALNPGARLSNLRTLSGEQVIEVATAAGSSFTLAADATTKLPSRVVSMADNPNLGDVAIETSFADYQEVNGMKLPARFTTKTDRWTTAELRVTRQTVDGDAGDLAAPAAATAPPAAAPVTVTAEALSKGIWLLAGQSHHSVLVEFADHLTLIEAPQSEVRTLAVIAKARELRPDKPLTHVVNTHHHFDHSAGMRGAIAEGLTVVTQAGNAAFMKDVAARAHTIMPDALAKNAIAVKVETVDDELTLKDQAMTVALYHVAGNPHTDTMLMAYFPRERLLVEADAFTPGAAVAPYAANLLQNVQSRKLRVDRIVPLHGQAAPFAELQKTVQALAQ